MLSKFIALIAVLLVPSPIGEISLAPVSNITLVSEIGSIPLTVSNTYQTPVIVSFEALSDDPTRLVVDSPKNVEIKANTEQKVELPVHARANGIVEVTVRMYNDQSDLGEITFEVNSNRDIGRFMGYAFYILIVMLLGFGIYRTIKKSRGKLTEDE